jgi:hypothetical protein
MPQTAPKTITLTEAQTIALHNLGNLFGHAFLKEAFVHDLEDAFGVKRGAWVTTERANTGQFKGLEVDDVGPNTLVRGAQAWVICDLIAEALGIAFRSDIEGRGSRFAACMSHIMKHVVV